MSFQISQKLARLIWFTPRFPATQSSFFSFSFTYFTQHKQQLFSASYLQRRSPRFFGPQVDDHNLQRKNHSVISSPYLTARASTDPLKMAEKTSRTHMPVMPPGFIALRILQLLTAVSLFGISTWLMMFFLSIGSICSIIGVSSLNPA